jgi:hypothetical protein
MPLGTPTAKLKKTCGKEPCPTCPYRVDTPRGIWELDHYEALTKYDGDIPDQIENGAFASFGCHKDNGHYCRGWIDCHGADNLLAIRLNGLTTRVGPPAVEVFESGAACLEANLPHMKNPLPEAKEAMAKLNLHIRAKRKKKA